MGSVGEIEAEGRCGEADTVFVAVGRNVEKCKATLHWAVRNFSGKRICLLHVHQPMSEYAWFGDWFAGDFDCLISFSSFMYTGNWIE